MRLSRASTILISGLILTATSLAENNSPSIQRPYWTERSSYVSADRLYLVGVASKISSIEKGRALALENAKNELRNQIGATSIASLVFKEQMTFEEKQGDNTFNVFRLVFLDLSDYQKFITNGGYSKRKLIEDKWPNGKTKAKYVLRDGLYDEEFESWDDAGHLNTKGKYELGKRVGNWAEYWPSGKLESQCTFSIHEETGNCEALYENGTVALRYSYRKGEKEGPVRAFHENGKLWQATTLRHGEMDGNAKMSFPTGDLAVESVFKMGQVISSTTYDYYSSGRLESTFNYVDDKAHGKWIRYYESGTKKAEGSNSHGDPDGSVKSYYPNGNLADNTIFRKGKKHGASVSYHPNGLKAEMRSFENDVLSGPFKRWNENGVVILNEVIVDGERRPAGRKQ